MLLTAVQLPAKSRVLTRQFSAGYARLRNFQYDRTGAAVTRCVLLGYRTSVVRANCVRKTSMKRRNKVVQEITRNVANVFSFYAITAIEHGFSMHWHCFAKPIGKCWKPRPPASVFNTSLGTWRTLMREKPCLVPILLYYVPITSDWWVQNVTCPLDVPWSSEMGTIYNRIRYLGIWCGIMGNI